MRRVVLASSILACTPTTRPDPVEEPPHDAVFVPAHLGVLERAPAGTDIAGRGVDPPLLLYASFSFMPAGGGGHLVVYDDGRAYLRGGGGFDDPARAWSMRLPADELERLRALLGSRGYAESDESYDERGVMDGGGVELADAISDRRIMVINDPPLPPALDAVHETAEALYRRLREHGKDALDDPDDALRMLAFHRQWWADNDDSYDLAVYADGRLELCQIAGAEDRYPACTVEIADADTLAPLRRALASGQLQGVGEHSLDDDAPTTHYLHVRGFPGWVRIEHPQRHPSAALTVLAEMVALRDGVARP